MQKRGGEISVLPGVGCTIQFYEQPMYIQQVEACENPKRQEMEE
jgi:hypothetical protein